MKKRPKYESMDACMEHRLKMVEHNERLICSRIFDEGLDLPDLVRAPVGGYKWFSTTSKSTTRKLNSGLSLEQSTFQSMTLKK